MPSKQGDLSLLNHPVAQELLQSTYQAKLAYIWSDGTPRVVPLWFHWNGSEIVFGSPSTAPKFKALHNGAKVTVMIDTPAPPYYVLTIRGTVKIDVVDGISPEYALSARRHIGEKSGGKWLAKLAQLSPQMTRITVTPEWVSVIDHRERYPSAIEKGMEAAPDGA